MKVISHSLPDETVRRLDDAAAAAQRSRSNLVRVVLEGWLANPSSAPLARETLDTLDRRSDHD
jgi:hypothetical protein